MCEWHQGLKCEKDLLASTNSNFMPEECSNDRKGKMERIKGNFYYSFKCLHFPPKSKFPCFKQRGARSNIYSYICLAGIPVDQAMFHIFMCKACNFLSLQSMPISCSAILLFVLCLKRLTTFCRHFAVIQSSLGVWLTNTPC